MIDCSNMVFVVIYKGNYIIQQCMQVDGGNAALELAQQKGYKVRIWGMHGMSHFNELDKDTREEIKEYVQGLE